LRVTNPLLDVLEAFLYHVEDQAELHGWAIMKTTKRSGPTVYGVLDRLEEAGWITGRWEDQHPDQNRPRRRLYRLTPTGRAEATDLLSTRRPENAHRRLRPVPPGLALVGWLRTLLPGGVE
jgi:DNA-binding PadR family transcriptional regulator